MSSKTYKKEWKRMQAEGRKLNALHGFSNGGRTATKSHHHPFTYLWYLERSDYNKVHREAFINKFKRGVWSERKYYLINN